MIGFCEEMGDEIQYGDTTAEEKIVVDYYLLRVIES